MTAKTLRWTYGSRTYSVEADPSESPYFGKCQMSRSLEFLPFYSTVDDPVMKGIAESISDRLPDCADDAYAAGVVLAMVQGNVRYASDMEVYGEEDLWGLPAVVLHNGAGDCDCMTDLYVSVAHNLDLDVASVVVAGHMFPAVRMDWDGVFYRLGGARYYHIEVTDDIPVAGRYWAESEVEAWSGPAVPSDWFRSTLTACPSGKGSVGRR